MTRLVAFVGLEGCGKSTQLNRAMAALEEMGVPTVVSKAYDDRYKELMAPFLSDPTFSDTGITLLFQALHAQQASLVEQALAAGMVVLADRYDESYEAYHRNFGPLAANPSLREGLNHMAFGDRCPDLTFFFDVEAEVAAERRRRRGRYEPLANRGADYYTVIRQEYHNLADERGWVTVDASGSIIEIHREVMKHLRQVLSL